MNLYGDRGNITALRRRCEWRGIDLELQEISLGERFTPRECDLFFFGGGQDREQVTVSRDLAGANGEAIIEAVSEGAGLLSVCGGYQLLCRYFRTSEGEDIPGVGLFDAYTVGGPTRFVGNVVAERLDGDEVRTLVGFENHSGRTHLGPGLQALGRVVVGHGNNGEDSSEGAVHRNAIGTYLHGPVLPKNPWLADRLIHAGLTRRYGTDAILETLDDSSEQRAHESVARTVRRAGNVRTSIR
ncbi:MAG: putative cobyric acid synthase cobq [Chloroflexi bacterium]|nr:putative cobyric acid synthase cobq [Chloroflexota bacterium]